MSFRREPESSSVREDHNELEEYCNCLLAELQHAEHAMIDLMLYLDTHPMDFLARQQYMAWSQHYMMLKMRYQQSCGPLEWYAPNWWQRAMGFGYDPLDECFEDPECCKL
ncbi:MAG TPA: spore coat protein CotJB [Bacillota bacterium]|nr:spore coat protein CotJB [Bacillota bacterium]